MMKTLLKCLLGISALIAINANATIIGVTGAGIKVPPPPVVLDGSVATPLTHQYGFDEKQSVGLGGPIAVDGGGTIGPGVTVDSHMIFFNQPGTTPCGPPGCPLLITDAIWTFSGIILGVMSDAIGSLEVASSPLLGNPATGYPGATFSARGMEGGDFYTVMGGGSSLRVHMEIVQPGDWIRVITASANVPEPASIALMALGLAGLGFSRRKHS